MNQNNEIKSCSINLSKIILESTDMNSFEIFLKRKINQVPHLFKKMPILIDLININENEDLLVKLNEIVNIVNQLNLVFIGFLNPQKKDKNFINDLGYPVFFDNYKDNLLANKEEVIQKENNIEKEKFIEKIKNDFLNEEGVLFHEGVVRSGQTIFAKNKSLVVLGSVRNGAEIISDGDIFVFGKIEGKVIAGASGSLNKKIIALKMNPSLISIGGNYKIFEEKDALLGKENIKISFSNNTFKIEEFTF